MVKENITSTRLGRTFVIMVTAGLCLLGVMFMNHLFPIDRGDSINYEVAHQDEMMLEEKN